jgi:hypothetical protein
MSKMNRTLWSINLNGGLPTHLTRTLIAIFITVLQFALKLYF